MQLDRALSKYASVISLTYEDIDSLLVNTQSREDVLLIHFENGLIPNRFDILLNRTQAKKIFCCHWFGPDIPIRFPQVDLFVVHRQYETSTPKTTIIPLGCPTYEPTESREAVRHRLGFPLDARVITTAGFLTKWKEIPATVDALLTRIAQNPQKLLLYVHTPWPFSTAGAREEELAVQNVLDKYNHIYGHRRFSTTFLGEKDLLDIVYASDLGFVFHPINTGSVSAATKQFVSARCPAVVTASTHSSDLMKGVVRINSFRLDEFTDTVMRTISDQHKLNVLRHEMQKEYERINMDAIAQQYIEAFKRIV